jgi:hypothetical protein
MSRSPVAARRLISSILVAVGMLAFMFWSPSRGPTSRMRTVRLVEVAIPREQCVPAIRRPRSATIIRYRSPLLKPQAQNQATSTTGAPIHRPIAEVTRLWGKAAALRLPKGLTTF